VRAFYESEEVLAEYLLFHYGKQKEILPYDFGPIDALDFPARVVRKSIDFSNLPENPIALDLGCSVGRSSFELARNCRSVLGIDSSKSFIEAAKKLQINGQISSSIKIEGDLRLPFVARISSEIDRSRVRFEVGDAMNLSPKIGQFDLILMANLIDRLPNPAALLDRISDFLNPGGKLVVTSPNTWLEEFTPRGNWLGGFAENGKSKTTFDTLQEKLLPSFELIKRLDLPFLIREHARKFQWSVADATIWKKRRQPS